MEISESYYLGGLVDPESGKVTDQPLFYDPADLTTHAVVVGMTGSGKTGLCIDLLEEAALHGIPALMIDPKGDITNELLHFPDLLPADFQPWVNPDEARRSGLSLEQAGAQAAQSWREGLATWKLGPEDIRRLKEAVEYTIYTPGSNSGYPVSILASFTAPQIPWEENRELLREKISGTVTAILGLLGIHNIDPVRSREHILLSNIFEHAWSQGKDLNLGELILQTQNPPFAKLGVFDVNTFFPENDRFALSMLLNNILASPAFQSWIEGQPLDIASMLWSPEGKPRHSVFYIAHLSEAERMFFVTLLYSAVESWMRAQPGTTTLRAILYFDEIFGYLPPLGNPPSKEPMLRMLKQARAFGVGQVLATQNPVDVDYKALSNAGTWMIGKLQTDQDKQRLLDGLEGATGGAMDRSTYDRSISRLGKRQFLMHNVHEKGPQIFGTRWAMNYLAGPLTRTQIPALNTLNGTPPSGRTAPVSAPAPQAGREYVSGSPQSGPASAPAPQAVVIPPARTEADGFTASKPAPRGAIAEFFLPNNLTFNEALKIGPLTGAAPLNQGLVYRPYLLAQAQVRFFNRKYNLDSELLRTVLVAEPDRRGVVRWEDFPSSPVEASALDRQPASQARFAALEGPLADVKILTSLEKDFLDWAYRSSEVVVRAVEALKLYAGPDVSQAEFRTLAAEAAREGRDAEADKVAQKYDRQLATLQTKLAREERELEEDEEDLSQRKMEEYGTHAENLFGLFGGRKSSRRLTSSLSKRRMTAKAKADVEESKDVIEELQKQIADLEKEKAGALEEVNARWADLANEVSEIKITPLKKDVSVELFGIAWMPYYLAEEGGRVVEVQGYA